MSTIHSTSLRILLSALLGVSSMIATFPAYSLNSFLNDWRTTYPSSNSDDAGCQVCHGASTKQLNNYGKDLCNQLGGVIPNNIGPTLTAIANLNSDIDATGSTNAIEIGANTQPGWRSGDTNPLFDTNACELLAADSTVPSNVPQPLDPANVLTAVTGGPYEGLVNVAVTFDATASVNPNAEIASYLWDFGDGTNDTKAVTTHSYTTAGIYEVILTVFDNAGTSAEAVTTATISEKSLLDLDISGLSVSSSARVNKAFRISLTVQNNGTVLGQAIATVVGMKDGVEVYRQRLNVFDDLGRGTTTFDFGTYKPTTAGTINWTATIDDADKDVDNVTATTIVK